MKKTEIQDIAFKMIGIIGQAKFMAMKSYNEYKQHRDKKILLKNLKNAEIKLGEVGKIHMDVVSEEAKGKDIKFSTIFMHAEDQFMTTQMMIEMLILISGE